MRGLEVQKVHKTYGTKKVVDDISFHAPPGKILGILGPNGAGKTTIIRMIMNITAPDQGNIMFKDGRTEHKGIPLASIGYLPEERGLYKEAKIMNILLFLASLNDVPKHVAKERILRWLTKFELEKYANSKVEQLSKGMAQKVQFIGSVLHEPKFIILDEPFSGLDPVSQDMFKTEIRALANLGASILLSSHQMNIVEELCDDIFLIHQGREVVKGDLQTIKERYGNFRVNMLSEAPNEVILNTGLVVESEKLGHARYRYTLKDRVSPLEFTNSLPADLEIRELIVSRPSLHDIFVKIAQGGAEVASNMENS
ncbi:MAG: ATP-binding cassette domain-containing protein [Bacillota bacterium]|nr:ATP-binding cassette domain-containing protein [Bacillota bacterium]